jgi:hypothetical protein
MTTDTATVPLAVGDLVRLVAPVRHRPELALGVEGVVLVAGLGWDSVTVCFGPQPQRVLRDGTRGRKCYLLKSRLLQRVGQVALPPEDADA